MAVKWQLSCHVFTSFYLFPSVSRTSWSQTVSTLSLTFGKSSRSTSPRLTSRLWVYTSWQSVSLIWHMCSECLWKPLLCFTLGILDSLWLFVHMLSLILYMRRTYEKFASRRVLAARLEVLKCKYRNNGSTLLSTSETVNKCVFSQQSKPHTPTWTGKLTTLGCVCVYLMPHLLCFVSFFNSSLFFLFSIINFFSLFTCHPPTHTCIMTPFSCNQGVRLVFDCCSFSFLDLLPLLALTIPVDVPAMWDPSATLDPTATLAAEVAVQQVQIMASIVLALLSEPFCEYHKWLYTIRPKVTR